jgi:hypothetical protein
VSTIVVLACVLLPLLAGAASLRAGALASLPSLVVMALTLARVDGVGVGSLLHRRLRWAWASVRGYRTFLSGPVVDHRHAWSLPGSLASTELLSVDDGRGGKFAIVWDRRSGLLTATLLCAAASTWLVDGDEADGWVGNWHSWLASLGYLPMVRWVTVTVDTAPEPGMTLRDNVFSKVSPSAPRDVTRLVHDLVQRSPAASADIETRVSITFDTSRSSQRFTDPVERFTEVSRQLVGLESALTTCGVTVLRRATAEDIAATVRTAYDPISRGEVERLLTGDPLERDGVLGWADSGPVAAEDRWDSYRHDSGFSVSWGWHEPPRQQVTSGILTRLMSPGRFVKRVSVLYRPLPAGQAARLLEEQVNAAAFRDAYRRAQKRDETARDIADRERAQQAAREEGAGVVVMSVYVTATVTDEAQLAGVVSEVEARADQSKLRVRRLYGSQSVGFATTLPLGVCPAHLATWSLT